MQPLEPLRPVTFDKTAKELEQDGPCACGPNAAKTPEDPSGWRLRYGLWGAALAAAWLGLYVSIKDLAAGAVALTGLDPATGLGAALSFFFYDAPKVLLLLALAIFVIGVVRSFFSPAATRRMLAGRREAPACALAAGLGVLTPFCSCSAVPLFIGFVHAGIPLSATFSFLVSAPMVNEVALILLYGLFGWQVAGLYLVTGLVVAVSAGLVIGRLKMEDHLQDWVRLAQAEPESATRMTWKGRVDYGLGQVHDIVGKIWLYVLAGIGVGAGIHGYVPEGAMASLMGAEAWWSVPLAVVLGIPMYAGAAGMVPILAALLEKGAALGTALAFMMSVVALSLPEVVILKKVLKTRLIAVFVAVVGSGILLVGYFFNLVLA